jgi:uncharacterized membrane protein
MKALCTHAVDIHAPADAAFDYVCDLTHWPAWFGCVVSASQPSGRPVAIGEEIHVCMNRGRRRWQEDFEVTRFITNAFFSLEALYSAARRIDFRFERRGKVTRLSCAIGYPLYGGILPAIVDAVLGRRRVHRCVRESLVHLKNVLEEKAGVASAPDDLDALSVPPVARPVPQTVVETVRVG